MEPVLVFFFLFFFFLLGGSDYSDFSIAMTSCTPFSM